MTQCNATDPMPLPPQPILQDLEGNPESHTEPGGATAEVKPEVPAESPAS